MHRTSWFVALSTLVAAFAAPAISPLPLAAQGSPVPRIDSLRERVRARIAEVPGAEVGVAWHELGGRGAMMLIDGDSVFHAASTMKVPVMIELFRGIERGAFTLDQPIMVVNSFRSIVDGSPFSVNAGDDSDSTLYARVGTRVPVRELLELMIVRSSNLATNILIDLVGAAETNATAHALGATGIEVLRGVEDGKAYQLGRNNTTTAQALMVLLESIERGEAASAAHCRAMLDILLRQEFNDEIPAGLPPGTRVAHKTGQISGVLPDAAIVYPEGASPYVLVVLTREIPDDRVARRLIADVARLVHAESVRP
jgi:beta-lactamase class A